jgi:hypothetical protein
MTTRPRRVRRTSLWLVPCVLLLVGCGRGQAAVPAGAQLVAVSATGSEVRLDPATVRAGDVYVVLETPGSSVGFVQGKSTAAERPGPLTDEDLARLAHGDTQGTEIGGFDDTGCSPEQRAEDRGRMGPCGNVFKLVLEAGRYAFFAGDLDGAPPGDHSGSIAILEVLP